MRNVRVITGWLGVFFITACVLGGMGCKSLSLERHLVIAESTALNLDRLADVIAQKSSEGIIPSDKRQLFVQIHEELTRTQDAYVDALKAYRLASKVDPNASSEEMSVAFGAFQMKVAEAVPQFLSIGVDVYKYLRKGD